jgi:anti-sigma regulatory factor (Ser/Thr protein kinase)
MADDAADADDGTNGLIAHDGTDLWRRVEWRTRLEAKCHRREPATLLTAGPQTPVPQSSTSDRLDMDCYDREIRMRFTPSVSAPRVARRAVEQCVGADAPTEFVYDAVLLTSELVTNAVTHTAGGSELSAYYDPSLGRLRVEVSDTSPVVPELREGAPGTGPGGRGLRIVDTVAARWGTTLLPSGKYVWFELRST